MLKGLKRHLGGSSKEDATRAQPRQRTSESGLESGDSDIEASARSTQPSLEGYGLKVLFDPVEPVVTIAE
jgi:hypothetical protein